MKEEIEGIPSPATIKLVRNKLKPFQRKAGGLLKVGENAFDNAGVEQSSVHRTGTLYSVRYAGCLPGCCRPVPSVRCPAASSAGSEVTVIFMHPGQLSPLADMPDRTDLLTLGGSGSTLVGCPLIQKQVD